MWSTSQRVVSVASLQCSAETLRSSLVRSDGASLRDRSLEGGGHRANSCQGDRLSRSIHPLSSYPRVSTRNGCNPVPSTRQASRGVVTDLRGSREFGTGTSGNKEAVALSGGLPQATPDPIPPGPCEPYTPVLFPAPVCLTRRVIPSAVLLTL